MALFGQTREGEKTYVKQRQFQLSWSCKVHLFLRTFYSSTRNWGRGDFYLSWNNIFCKFLVCFLTKAYIFYRGISSISGGSSWGRWSLAPPTSKRGRVSRLPPACTLAMDAARSCAAPRCLWMKKVNNLIFEEKKNACKQITFCVFERSKKWTLFLI